MALATAWITLARSEHTRATLSRRDLIPLRTLQQLLGGLWLLAGALQLQPWMWSMNLITGVMQPAVEGQPGPIAMILQFMVTHTAPYHVAANAAIAVVQLALGFCLLRGIWVRPALAASVAWSLAVWVGGEGFGMMLTGQASALTGAPGAVLLYAVVALAAYPSTGAPDEGLLARRHVRWVLSGFWALAAVLQLQPFWWQSNQIARAISAMQNPGTLHAAIFGGSLRWLAAGARGNEVSLNIAIVAIAVGLATTLAVFGTNYGRLLPALSIALSMLLWWATEGFGLLLTGTATDVNSGPLLVLLALACWQSRNSAGRRTSDYIPQH